MSIFLKPQITQIVEKRPKYKLIEIFKASSLIFCLKLSVAGMQNIQCETFFLTDVDSDPRYVNRHLVSTKQSCKWFLLRFQLLIPINASFSNQECEN